MTSHLLKGQFLQKSGQKFLFFLKGGECRFDFSLTKRSVWRKSVQNFFAFLGVRGQVSGFRYQVRGEGYNGSSFMVLMITL